MTEQEANEVKLMLDNIAVLMSLKEKVCALSGYAKALEGLLEAGFVVLHGIGTVEGIRKEVNADLAKTQQELEDAVNERMKGYTPETKRESILDWIENKG